jgi:hypothetical protein
MKFLTKKLFGYGGSPRRPLPPIDPEDAERLWEHPHVQELINKERELSVQPDTLKEVNSFVLAIVICEISYVQY